MTTTVPEHSLLEPYLRRVAAGLKGIEDTQRQEILAEIRSHLQERTSELSAQAGPEAEAQALATLGDPAALAARFVAEIRTQHELRSYAPWTLLRAAARVAFSGIKAFLVFLLGAAGYVMAFAALITAILKPFFPQVGLWVGSFGMVWGMKPEDAPGRELLGGYFVYATIALSFVLASGTTLLLRHIKRPPSVLRQSRT